MSDDRKKSVWPWIIALLIGLPVLYVLSFGPACWIATRHEPMRGIVNSIYSPAAWAYFKAPNSVGNAIIWYANVGGDINFCGTERGGFRLEFVPDMHADLPPPSP